jgi:hypothetical protein
MLKFKKMFKKFARFDYNDISTLKDMAIYMGQTPITGLNSLNNLLSFCRLPTVPIEAPLVRIYTKRMLVR